VKHFEPSVLRNSISSYSMTRFWIEFLNKHSGALPTRGRLLRSCVSIAEEL